MMNAQESGKKMARHHGFNKEYESLSDEEEEVETNPVNPFATTSVRTSRTMVVETVSEEEEEEVKQHSPSPSPSSSAMNDFDPLSPKSASQQQQQQQQQQSLPQNSLLDDSEQHQQSVRRTSQGTAGMAGYLEMEDEPIRQYTPETQRVLEEQEDLIDFTPSEEPISTSSGLLLTHRKTSTENRVSKKPQYRTTKNHTTSAFPPNYRPSSTRFEVETISPWSSLRAGGSSDPFGFAKAPTAMLQVRRLLSFAKIWVVFFCVVLLLGTAGMLHSFRHERSGGGDDNWNQADQQELQDEVPSQIYLLPLENAAELARQQREAEAQLDQSNTHNQHQHHRRGARKLLSDLKEDLRFNFEEWILEHGKIYSSIHEKERRFQIWRDNHFRTQEKNKRHGNCKLMNKPVFGMNHLSDLTPEEFQTQFLTGYNGPNADGHEIKTGRKRKLSGNEPPVMHPDLKVKRHPEVHKRILQQWSMSESGRGAFTSSSRCKWYDISCWMRIVFNEYLYVGIGTMEPKYDADTYPKSMDWRELGALTDVRRQGDCGACWAITAVETIESAYFIGTGNLVDMSETEVISCTSSCNMCYGGWPQDAYDYAMEHGGIMPSNDWSYSGSTLLSLSEEMLAGEDELDSDMFASYISQNCPASQEGSGDNSASGRYGNIDGYGFATDRCVCYSDGSGCDCDNQNEGVALRNVASYGPATVCLDASTWQDYSGGILTASSGCSAKFLAMNHCVQVVGYAYNDGSYENDQEQEGSGSNDSHDSGSNDESQREGYWIVRNQWGSYWGMNGYAYVAMGENTCGILNDMTQAYM